MKDGILRHGPGPDRKNRSGFMKNRKTFRRTAVLALCVAFALSAASCGEGLITTNSAKDMEQVVGNVDISNYDEFQEGGIYAEYADAVSSVNSTILKRDLVAYFLNSGYTYVNSYGYSYEETFNLLMDNLVSRKIMVQYAMAYYFERSADAEDEYAGVFTVSDYTQYVDEETEKLDASLRAHYEKHPELLTLQYFITDGGSDYSDYDRAIYTLKSMINNTLDSTELTYIEEEDSSSSSGDTRTTPANVGTETEDYYPVDADGKLDYDVYTGRNTLDSCGAYEAQEGSKQSTRRRAYNDFLSNLSMNNLLVDGEDTSDLENIDYYYVELASQLEQALINKYSDDLNEEANAELTKEYVEGKYASILASQKNSYDDDQSAFETAIGSVSDTSFVLYSPKEGFGFVYNILLPFSTTQSQILSTYTNDTGLRKTEFYEKRAALLENIRAKDLRTPWFSADEDSNYAFEATADDAYYKNAFTLSNEAAGNKTYLFFEDNLKKSEGDNAQYEDLGQYYGQYPYNGKAEFDEENEEWKFYPEKLSVDGFMDEMENYLAYAGLTAAGAVKSDYMQDFYDAAENEFDYSKFIYYEGKVSGAGGAALGGTSHDEYFVKGTEAYTAVSVINELMFAYSSDTGCLNTYMGYTVSPYKTDYVAEFEYAAQYAIRQGVGTYVVCPSDYGWHVIYVSFAYDAAGEVYGGFNWDERETEGTFSYLFYESLKSDSSSSSSYASMVQNQILGKYNNDTCVKLYKNRYKDLLSLDA